VEFVRLGRSADLFRSVPEGIKACGIADPGRTYLVYLESEGPGRLGLDSPDGSYGAQWVSTQTGEAVHEATAVARHGTLTLEIPAFSGEMALRGCRATDTERRVTPKPGGRPTVTPSYDGRGTSPVSSTAGVVSRRSASHCSRSRLRSAAIDCSRNIYATLHVVRQV
jgi:hypothetical protein